MIHRMSQSDQIPPSNRLSPPILEDPYAPAAPDRENWTRRIERTLGDYPIALLVIGAAAGIALGYLVKRR